ncbi:hypothetical protein Cni_G22556 [Canna indica]|uniref:Reverse transcriptase zinc-binding domain-containing protein n=1 Tax=Canna indica TaxID=4628 RepID=A0AAQ3KUC6_9LILI|nr:hypothetical protein Cni_G22556 [Canna indica]
MPAFKTARGFPDNWTSGWAPLIFANPLLCGKIVVGSRLRTSLWRDKWLRNDTLQNKYLSLYALTTSKDACIADAKMLNEAREIVGWDINFSNFVHLIEVMELAKDLEETLHCSGEDTVEWKWNSSRVFPTSSLYKLLNFSGLKDAKVEYIWQHKFPVSISIFNWFFYRKRLHTKDRLILHGMNIRCVFFVVLQWRRMDISLKFALILYLGCPQPNSGHEYWGIPGWHCAFILMASVSLLIGALVYMTTLFVVDPRRDPLVTHGGDDDDTKRAISVTKSTAMRFVMKVQTFQVIVLQGIVGSLPWTAMVFFTMWIELDSTCGGFPYGENIWLRFRVIQVGNYFCSRCISTVKGSVYDDSFLSVGVPCSTVHYMLYSNTIEIARNWHVQKSKKIMIE